MATNPANPRPAGLRGFGQRWAGLSRAHRVNAALYALTALSMVGLLFEVVTGEDRPANVNLASQGPSSTLTLRSLPTSTSTTTSTTTASTTSTTVTPGTTGPNSSAPAATVTTRRGSTATTVRRNPPPTTDDDSIVTTPTIPTPTVPPVTTTEPPTTTTPPQTTSTTQAEAGVLNVPLGLPPL